MLFTALSKPEFAPYPGQRGEDLPMYTAASPTRMPDPPEVVAFWHMPYGRQTSLLFAIERGWRYLVLSEPTGLGINNSSCSVRVVLVPDDTGGDPLSLGESSSLYIPSWIPPGTYHLAGSAPCPYTLAVTRTR